MNPPMNAFVIMPFDPEFEAVYSDLIKPSLENSGYEVNRADSLMNQQNILKDIIRQIANADLVVAELTALNPNVFYELGIAHALRKRTVLLTQSIDDLPFDLRSYRVVSYSIRFDEIGKLAEALTTIAEKATSGIIDFSNPVIDFLPSDFSSPQQGTQLNPTHDPQATTFYPDEEKGLWDYAVENEASLVKAVEILNRLTQLITEMGERMTVRTAEVEKVKQSGIAGSAARMHKLIELSASEILSFSQQIESELPEFSSSWDRFAENTTGMLRSAGLKTPEDKAAVLELKGMLLNLAEQIPKSIESMKGLRDAQVQLKGISRSMNRASRRAVGATEQILTEYEKALAYTIKVTDLIDEMLQKGG